MKLIYEEKLEEFDDTFVEYDELFGEPSTEVFDIVDLLDYLDNVISFTESETTVNDGLNDKYDLLVDRVVATNFFKKAVKLLSKKKKTNVLKELKETIIKLGNYEIKGNKKNHPLTNAEGHFDLHLEGGNLILIYKYFNEEVFEIDVSQVSIERILRLQDVVDHKQLKGYDSKKYKASTDEFEIDNVYNKEEE